MGVFKAFTARVYDRELRHTTKGQKFSYKGLKFNAKIVDVYDGDTLTVVFRYRGELQQHSVRMIGYDSPEMKPPKTKPDREHEIAAAKEARKALMTITGFDEQSTHLVSIECHAFDKYGRILVNLYTKRRNRWWSWRECINVNQWMIDRGYGVPYDGGSKLNWFTQLNG